LCRVLGSCVRDLGPYRREGAWTKNGLGFRDLALGVRGLRPIMVGTTCVERYLRSEPSFFCAYASSPCLTHMASTSPNAVCRVWCVVCRVCHHARIVRLGKFRLSLRWEAFREGGREKEADGDREGVCLMDARFCLHFANGSLQVRQHAERMHIFNLWRQANTCVGWAS
jgi:hypothetical protein